MKAVALILIIFVNFLNSQELPPLPEIWSQAIEDSIQGLTTDNWLSNYTFLAKLRVKPGQHWNVRVEATWTGPSLLDPMLLNYLSLEFTPIVKDFNVFWTGRRSLKVSSYDHETKKIVFTPPKPEKFMKSSRCRTGVYNGMHFTLKIGDEMIPGMRVMVNTRINRDVEVTCSDGKFCNGEERYVKVGKGFKCLKAKYGPCDDPNGNPCASYKCIESQRECKTFPKGGSSCKSCNSTDRDINSICMEMNYECGWDAKKTIYCGKCPSKDLACSKGKCIPLSSLGEGSCNKPHLLYEKGLIIPADGLPAFTIKGDLSLPQYIDHVIPICNPSPITDVVYEFRIEGDIPMGIEVQMLKSDGTTDSMDTVLALTNETCDPLNSYSFCGDDNNPPGGVSSRIFGKLSAGTYKLVATGFSDVPANIGPFELRVKFYPNCVPQCEGNRKCGDDGCGGECGTCADGESCHLDSGRCRASPCIPQCTYENKEGAIMTRMCGEDGCGGLCGSCNLLNNEMCVAETGQCIKVQLCDNLLPVCLKKPPRKMVNPFCGNDCKWHSMSELFGDLVPNNKSYVIPSIEFNWVKVENRSCAVVEGCFKERGNRLLMRFDTYIHNTGRALFLPPPASQHPNYFEWSPCHSHFHFEGFALFNLYDMDSRIVSKGGKRGYCMEDTIRTFFGDHIPCTNKFDCTNQGIQSGWADLYPNVLDCQWLDITNIEKEKWYIYEICSNIERKLQESSNSNDCKRFAVYVPEVDFELEKPAIKYYDVLSKRKISKNFSPKVVLEPGADL